MLKFNKVVWTEGMLLQPQHFQQQDRFTEHLVHQHHYYYNEFYNGIFALEFDETLLEQGKIGIKSGRGKFGDGAIFNVPITEVAPVPLDLPKDTIDQIVYLGLPITRAGIPEFSLDVETNTKFNVATVEVMDCTSKNTSTAIQTGMLGLKLLLAGQNTQGYSLISIAKVKEIKGNNQVILDPAYIPTCVNVFACPHLTGFIAELLIALHNRGITLANWMAGSEYNSPVEMQDLLLLQLINKYEAIFNINARLTILHPLALFSTLNQLLAELAVFINGTYRAAIIVNYDHDDLYNTFQPMILELKRIFNVLAAQQDAIRVPLEEQPYNILTAHIPEEYLATELECILVVSSQLSPDELKQKFIAQIKLCTMNKIQTLISNALPGIPVQFLAKAPRRIPFDPKALYFALDTRAHLWQELKNTPHLALHLSGEYPGLTIECWLLKGKMQ